MTVAVGATGSNNRGIGIVTGIVPLAALAYGYFRLQAEGGNLAVRGVSEVAQNVIGIGVYITICLSIGILICSAQVKTSEK